MESPETASVYFHNAGRLYDWGLLLALGELLGTLTINVNPGEFLAICVINGHLPVMVLSPFIVAHSASLLGFAVALFHVE
jgi:hypothetical protein